MDRDGPTISIWPRVQTVDLSTKPDVLIPLSRDESPF